MTGKQYFFLTIFSTVIFYGGASLISYTLQLFSFYNLALLYTFDLLMYGYLTSIFLLTIYGTISLFRLSSEQKAWIWASLAINLSIIIVSLLTADLGY